MICPKCGCNNDDSAYFCEKCGYKLKEVGTVTGNQFDNNSSFDYYDNFNKNISYENPQNNYPKPPKNNKNLLITVIVVSAIAVIAICICVFLIFFNGKDSNSDTSASETVTSTVTETTTVTTTTEETEPTTEATVSKIMPNVVGLRKEEASGILRKQNISIRYEEENNNIYSEGVVSNQSIPSGETVRDGETVTLYVSLGSDEDTYYDGDYILPDSDTEYISVSEIEGMSKERLTLALNEIYARYGQMFNTTSIQKYFNSKSWYVPSIEPGHFDDSKFNDYERHNVDTIVNYMKEKGYR